MSATTTTTLSLVDRKFIENFLVLIRDNYAQAEEAHFFVEERSLQSNQAAIANLRDVLSHLATALDPSLSPKKRLYQRASAEEHLRRATLEPYYTGIGSLRKQFRTLYEDYKRYIAPIRHKYKELQGAPGLDDIENTLKEIARLASSGREAKRMNLWQPAWEKGLSDLVQAYDRQHKLFIMVQSYWHRYEQIKRDRKQMLLTIGSLIIGVVCIWQLNLGSSANLVQVHHSGMTQTK